MKLKLISFEGRGRVAAEVLRALASCDGSGRNASSTKENAREAFANEESNIFKGSTKRHTRSSREGCIQRSQELQRSHESVRVERRRAHLENQAKAMHKRCVRNLMNNYYNCWRQLVFWQKHRNRNQMLSRRLILKRRQTRELSSAFALWKYSSFFEGNAKEVNITYGTLLNTRFIELLKNSIGVAWFNASKHVHVQVSGAFQKWRRLTECSISRRSTWTRSCVHRNFNEWRMIAQLRMLGKSVITKTMCVFEKRRVRGAWIVLLNNARAHRRLFVLVIYTNAFRQWRSNTRKARISRKLFTSITLLRYVRLWVCVVRVQRLAKDMAQMDNIRQSLVIKSTWDSWSHKVSQSRERAAYEEAIGMVMRSVILKSGWKGFRVALRKNRHDKVMRQLVRENANMVRDSFDSLRLNLAFRDWRLACQRDVMIRQKMLVIFVRRGIRQLTSTLSKWKNFVQESKSSSKFEATPQEKALSTGSEGEYVRMIESIDRMSGVLAKASVPQNSLERSGPRDITNEMCSEHLLVHCVLCSASMVLPSTPEVAETQQKHEVSLMRFSNGPVSGHRRMMSCPR